MVKIMEITKKSEKNYNSRNSSIELLKIIAIIMIIFSHCLPFGFSRSNDGFINLKIATNDFQQMILVFFRYLGQIGNDIFIVCSSYYLLESKKLNAKKILYICGDVFFISIAYLVIFLILGYSLSTRTIFQQFFPITFSNNWFITCYLLFYMVHPILNIIIDVLDKRRLLYLNSIMLVLYAGIQVLFKRKLYYSRIIGFILIYFIVAYVKKYLVKSSNSVKVNRIVLIISTISLVGLILLTNFLGLDGGFFKNKILHWCVFVNPFMIFIAVSLFNLFNIHQFSSKIINYISSLSLIIYLVHDNKFITKYVRSNIFGFIYNTFSYENIVLSIIILVSIVFLLSVIISIIYKNTIGKLIKKICDIVYDRTINILENIFNRLLSFE